MAFSPDGNWLAVGGARALRLVRLAGKQTLFLKGHTDVVNSTIFAPDGATLWTAGDDGTVRIWDGRTGGLRLSIQYLLDEQKAGKLVPTWIAFTPDDRYSASSPGAEKRLRWRSAMKLSASPPSPLLKRPNLIREIMGSL